MAGGLLVVIGGANVGLALLGLATDLVRLTPATSGTLLVLGTATVAAGVLVWRGSRLALALSLTIFGMLLVVQLGEVAVAGAIPEGAGPRLAVLGALVAALALAQVTRSGRRSRPAGTSGAKARSR